MAYLGPGDIVGSALGFWGLRAYNGTYASGSGACIDVTANNGSVVTPTTINVTTTGAINLTQLNTAVASAAGSLPLLCSKIYDQVGTNNIVPGISPSVLISPTGLLTGMATLAFTTAQNLFTAAGISAHAQPNVTVITFQIRTSGSTAFASGVQGGGQTVALGQNTLTEVFMFAGSVAETPGGSAAENAWHGLGGVFNGASSLVSIDGSTYSLSGSPGAQGFDGTSQLFWNSNSGTGSICEVGLWASSWTQPQLNAYTNAATGNPNDGSVTFYISAPVSANPPPGSQLNVFYA